MENDDLKKQIDELFRLFKKVVEKYPPDEIPGIDKSQLDQLKAYLSQYEQIKDQFSVEMYGLPNNGMAKHFIEMLTRRLREQLGDAADISDEPAVSEVDVKEKVFESLQTGENYEALIEAIDNELKNKNLSMDQIDDLLDKRQKVLSKISK